MSKVLITVPDELLDRIDRIVKARKTTRSRFMEDAVRHELGWPEPDAMDSVIARAREALAPYGSFDSAAVIRGDREERDVEDR